MSSFRFGIGARLVAGMVLLALLALSAGAVSYLWYAKVQQGIDHVTTRHVPAMATASLLAQRSQTLGGNASDLVAADSQFSRRSVSLRINDQVTNLDELITRLRGYDVPQDQLDSIIVLRSALMENLHALDRSVEARIAADQRNRELFRLIQEIAGTVDKLKGELLSPASGKLDGANDPVVRGSLFQMERVLSLLLSSMGGTNARTLDAIRFEVEEALSAIGPLVGGLPEPAKDRLMPLVPRIRALAFGSDGVLDLQTERTAISRQIHTGLLDNRIASERFVSAVARVVAQIEAEALGTSGNVAREAGTAFKALVVISALSLGAAALILMMINRAAVRRLVDLSARIRARIAGEPVEIRTTGDDEIADIAKAVAFFMSGIADRENALRASEERLRAAIDALPDGMVMIDADMRFVIWNQRFLDHYPTPPGYVSPGASAVEALALLIRRGEFVMPVENEAQLQDLARRIMAPTARVFERRLASGRTIEVRVNPMAGGGQVRIFTDVTERRRHEQALRESEGRFRDLIEGSIQGIVIHRDFKPLFANRAYAAMLGFDSVEEVLALPSLLALIPPERHEEARADYQALVATGRSPSRQRLPCRRPDGTEFWVDVVDRAVDWMGEGAVQSTQIDVTDQVTSQRIERLLRQAMDNLDEAFTLYDAEDRLVFCNKRFLTGYPFLPPAEVLNGWPYQKVLRQIIAHDSVSDPRLEQLGAESWIAMRLEERRRRVSWASERETGDGRWYLIREYAIEGGGYVTIRTDVTSLKTAEAATRAAKDQAERALRDLRQTQESLVQAEKLASLGALVAGVAHEINTPVGIGITASTYLSEQTHEFDRKFRENQLRKTDVSDFVSVATEAAELIRANLVRAGDLVQNFKQVAVDRTSEARRSFDLRAYLDAVLVSLGPRIKRTNHRITLDCPEGIEMDGYPGALSQVIINLLMNAVIHAYGLEDAGNIVISATKLSNSQVRIVVADDGKGIPHDHRSRIFDPFFTTKRGEGGSGLGLHIVYNIVTVTLGGRITVDSAPGTGSRFIILLPRVAPETVAALQPAMA